MDSVDMVAINNIYMKILKKGRHIYNEAETNPSINIAQKLESYSTYLGQMNDKLESILDLTDKYAHECINTATDIRKNIDINDRYKDDPSRMFLAHKELYKGMSWADITEIEEEKEIVIDTIDEMVKKPDNNHDFKHTSIMYKDLSTIYGVNLGFECSIPIINKLNEMPSAMYWYEGDKKNPQGVYTCLSRKFYTQVPLPNVIDGTKDFNRTRSIKCKYNTLAECMVVSQDLASKYSSDVRECKFAHLGDKYFKIGSAFRCPNMPRFGNHAFLESDLENLPDYDIKMMLMYSLSDMLLGSLWFQKQNNNNMILTNIDTC
jgi:hypothetical protein